MIYKDLGPKRDQVLVWLMVDNFWLGPKCDQVLVWLMVYKDPNVIKS